VAKKTGSPFCGLPAISYVDNGKDYRSERLEGANIVERDIRPDQTRAWKARRYCR
jgi:hypothetical protein